MMENPIKIDDLGVPIFGNHHLVIITAENSQIRQFNGLALGLRESALCGFLRRNTRFVRFDAPIYEGKV